MKKFTTTHVSVNDRSLLWQRGFTLIEMMVALALFTVVITIAVGAFLSLIGQSSQLQGEQKVMTSLNFALDSMTREIRTGTSYYCATDVDAQGSVDESDLTLVKDCTGGVDGMSFVEAGSSLSSGSTGGRIAYGFNSASGTIVRQIAANSAEAMTSSDVKITSMKFYVSGSKPQSDGGTPPNSVQPTVTVLITAEDPDDTSKSYTLETTVTQRQLDL
jgi:prepilin-type N-terminal cleavage/methylation domain-containing protein